MVAPGEPRKGPDHATHPTFDLDVHTRPQQDDAHAQPQPRGATQPPHACVQGVLRWRPPDADARLEQDVLVGLDLGDVGDISVEVTDEVLAAQDDLDTVRPATDGDGVRRVDRQVGDDR